MVEWGGGRISQEEKGGIIEEYRLKNISNGLCLEAHMAARRNGINEVKILVTKSKKQETNKAFGERINKDAIGS